MLHFRKPASFRLYKVQTPFSFTHPHTIHRKHNSSNFRLQGFSTICSYVYLTSGKQLHLSYKGLSSRVVTIRLLSLLPSNCYLPDSIPSRTCCELGVEHEIHDRRFQLLDDRRLYTGNNGIPRPSHNLRKPVLRRRTQLATLRPRPGTPLVSKKNLPSP